MTHRRHIRRPSKSEKNRISSQFFQGDKFCEHCKQEVPRHTGGYHTVKGVVRWVCTKHVTEGAV